MAKPLNLESTATKFGRSETIVVNEQGLTIGRDDSQLSGFPLVEPYVDSIEC